MAHLNILKDTIIYIMAPANVDTGGPKDLHQLGYELKNLGKKVFMYYFPDNKKNPINKNYKIYNLPFVNEVEDSEKNILIVPEINTTIQLSKKYHPDKLQTEDAALKKGAQEKFQQVQAAYEAIQKERGL